MVCRQDRGTDASGGGQASHFYVTTAPDIHSLDEKHTIFGEVAEGMEVVKSINEEFVDEKNRPYVNIRITRCTVLEDPYPDPPGLDDMIPVNSPQIAVGADGDTRLEDGWRPAEETKTAEEIEKSMRSSEAKSRAVVLEMIGDLPDADAKPPDEFLFVCKLNPVTSDEDLEIIFSRFGKIASCDVIRDKKTGESLNYAFIGFEKKEDAERAYFKMDGVLIDDRRIKVDFSQSMHHLWRQYRKFGNKQDATRQAGAANDVHHSRGAPHANDAARRGTKNLELRGAAVANMNVLPLEPFGVRASATATESDRRGGDGRGHRKDRRLSQGGRGYDSRGSGSGHPDGALRPPQERVRDHDRDTDARYGHAPRRKKSRWQ